MKLNGLSIFIINFMAIIFITGCSSDNKGIFVDDIVDGIRYKNGVDESYTNDKGEFSYVGGKVEFYLGNIKIGELDHLPSDGRVFIQDLVGVDRTNISDEKVLKIATLLQSLDSDDTTDKIEILRKDFNKFYLVAQEDINNIEINELLLEKGFSPKGNMDVNKHLHNTLEYYEIIEDKQSLELMDSSIKNGDTNVFVDTDIVLNFNDDVRKTLVNKNNLILQDSSSNNIDFSILYDFDTIIITPLNNLEYSNTYTLKIKSTLQDYGKNGLINDGGNNDITIGFTTQAEQPLEVDEELTSNVQASIKNLRYAFIEGEEIVFDASESSDINNSTLTYQWSDSSNNILSTDAIYKNNSLPTGIYNITLTVKNENNESDTLSFEIGVYGTITTSVLKNVWLDRNLGAKKVCENYDYEECFGYYYQWGRNNDGHQKIDSKTSKEKIIIKDGFMGSENFIIKSKYWADEIEYTYPKWSATDGSSICPVGFRVPTKDELREEAINQGIIDDGDRAKYTELRLSFSGYRKYSDGKYSHEKKGGGLWTDNDYEDTAHVMTFYSGGKVHSKDDYKALGFPVRCIKD